MYCSKLKRCLRTGSHTNNGPNTYTLKEYCNTWITKTKIHYSVRYRTFMIQYLRILRDILAFNYIRLSTDVKSITKTRWGDDEEANVNASNRSEWEVEKFRQEEIRSIYPGSTETKVGAIYLYDFIYF